MKPLCAKCSNNLAVWMYMPHTYSTPRDIYFCDDCVPRGCFCNVDPNTGEEDKDPLGRFYPCCEYMYDDRGFHLD